MAIDTALKRASAIQFKQIFRMALPFPSGTIGLGQRLLLAYEYAGIQPGPPSTSSNGIFSIGLDLSIFRIAGGIFDRKNSIMQT